MCNGDRRANIPSPPLEPRASVRSRALSWHCALDRGPPATGGSERRGGWWRWRRRRRRLRLRRRRPSRPIPANNLNNIKLGGVPHTHTHTQNASYYIYIHLHKSIYKKKKIVGGGVTNRSRCATYPPYIHHGARPTPPQNSYIHREYNTHTDTRIVHVYIFIYIIYTSTGRNWISYHALATPSPTGRPSLAIPKHCVCVCVYRVLSGHIALLSRAQKKQTLSFDSTG